MFSPHDSPGVTDWFRRFDAACRHLPAEERAAQREEVQQHLEGLAAAKTAQGQATEAAWKAALMQFGDPAQIGCKMYQEWRLGRIGFSADMKAIFFGMGLSWLQSLIIPLYGTAWLLWRNSHGPGGFNGSAPQLPIAVYHLFGFSGTLLICIAIGRKYPLQAIKAAFYSSLLWSLIGSLEVIALANFSPKMVLPQPMAAMIAYNLLLAPEWALGHSAIAYLASVTRRGWYKPSLADFKLTLPRRRPQLSR